VRYTPGSYVIGPYLRLHQALYERTDGRVGKHVGGSDALLLHTTGRRTGKPRTAALLYARDGDACVVVASNGGAPRHPGWFLNLRADPQVEVQVGRRRWRARARTATGDERERLWRLVNRTNRGLAPLFHPGAAGRYEVYQRHTTREIPVVVLEPEAGPDRPPA
jgi:deazaflavin-dependent oxidoreductase (nitroreductase family)